LHILAEFLGSAAEWRRNPKPNFILGYPLYGTVDGFLLELARKRCELSRCACTLLGCCAADVAAIPVTGSAGALFVARLSDGLDACSGGCVPNPGQSGFVVMAIITISPVHAATIASQLINRSTEYPRRRRSGCYSHTLKTLLSPEMRRCGGKGRSKGSRSVSWMEYRTLWDGVSVGLSLRLHPERVEK